MIEKELEAVQRLMLGGVLEESLRPVAKRLHPGVQGGKMLRARLVLRLGEATDVPSADCRYAATAVELIHTASLLHDDVIDEGLIRRNQPALWVREGIKGAVLLGDLMVCHAFELVQRTGNGSLVRVLTEVAREMCEAEVEQALHLQEQTDDWETCVSVARRKTGSLFSFAGYAAAGTTGPLAAALREAGYSLGTAYQLADDMFDAYGDPLLSDKTLGRDAAGARLTAASTGTADGVDPKLYVSDLCERARSFLSNWPTVQRAWDDYVSRDMGPALKDFLNPMPAQALS